jgi:hypothetical protein
LGDAGPLRAPPFDVHNDDRDGCNAVVTAG